VELTPVFSKNGRLEQMISVHTDITDLKKAGDDLKQLTEDLYRQNKELYQFAYIVSHDLRAPVASIVGLANLLEVYKNDEETLSDGLKDLVKAAHNLDEVIHDLSHILEVTNNGGKQLFKEDIDIHEVLSQIITNLHEVITHTGTHVSMPEEHCFIYTNKAYLHSIFYNLLSNAVKYRSEKPPEISISYQCLDEQIVFTVADNGIGIDLSKHADAVFKPYRRFTNLREGKGLGLFLVKSHVEALGGSISLASEPGKGSTFEFSISTGK
jgi:signal transduction histidine kinase